MLFKEIKFRESELGPIPVDWGISKLSELGEISRGKSKHRPRDDKSLYGGEFPFIQTGDIKFSGGLITEYRQTYNNKGLAQSRLWPKGTICITIAANIAETGILTFPACFPDSVIGFIADDKKCSSKFVEYALRYLKEDIKSYIIGSVQDNINLGVLNKVVLPYPDIYEQEKIAEVLGSLDEKIELNRKINKTLEEMGQGIISNSLGRGSKTLLVKELLNVQSGFPFSSKSFDPDGEYGIVTIKNVQDGSFITDCTNNISELPSKMPKYINLENGDVILSLTGNVGRISFVYGKGKYLLNQRVAKLEPLNDNSGFVYFYFRRREVQEFMISISKGTAQQNLSPVELANSEIELPIKIDETDQQLKPLFSKLVSNLNEIETLSQIRDSLLLKLMSGKIRLK